MIQVTPHMRILVAVEPVDFRAGIDGLAGACRQRLQADPHAESLHATLSQALRSPVPILVGFEVA